MTPSVFRCRTLNPAQVSALFARKVNVINNGSFSSTIQMCSQRLFHSHSKHANAVLLSSHPLKLPLHECDENGRRSSTTSKQRDNELDIHRAVSIIPKYSRFFFSSSTPSKDTGHSKSRLLYQRDPERLLFPRYLVGFNMFHSVYWVWYVVDFVPAVAAKGAFEVNELVGSVGLGLALIMLGGSCLYPRFLVGEISRTQKGNGTIVKCYTLPFVRLETNESATVYPRGKLRIENETARETILKDGKKSLWDVDRHLGIEAEGSRFPLLIAPLPEEVVRETELASILLETDGIDKQRIKKVKKEKRGNDGVLKQKPAWKQQRKRRSKR